MFKLLARGVLSLVAVSVAIVPGDSRACCFTHCFKRQTTYVPPTCDVCPQQVSYVPQTCYRTVYSCVPCTSYRPVTTCDPCTGCPQTVMQPVTTYVRRPVSVPYTTYRPVVSAVNYPASPCATGNCGGAAYYSPTSMTAPGGCSTCGTGATVGYGAPAATYATPGAPGYAAPAYSAPTYAAPTYAAPTYGGPAMSAPQYTTPQPSLNTPTPAVPNGSMPPNTFQPSQPQDNSSLRPIEPPTDSQPSEQRMNSSSAPRLLDPQNRTTAYPARPYSAHAALIGPATVMPAIFQTAKRPTSFKPASVKTQVDDGWRPMGAN